MTPSIGVDQLLHSRSCHGTTLCLRLMAEPIDSKDYRWIPVFSRANMAWITFVQTVTAYIYKRMESTLWDRGLPNPRQDTILHLRQLRTQARDGGGELHLCRIHCPLELPGLIFCRYSTRFLGFSVVVSHICLDSISLRRCNQLSQSWKVRSVSSTVTDNEVQSNLLADIRSDRHCPLLNPRNK